MISQDCTFHYSILSCMRTCWLTRLDLRHSRKVDGHNFLSLSTPVKTEKKERRKTSGKSATLIMHINYILFSFRWGLNFLNLLTLDKALEQSQQPNRTKFNIIINQQELRVKSGNLFQARENATDQVGIGCRSALDQLRWWRKFCRPIAEQGKQIKAIQDYFWYSIKYYSRSEIN